MKFSFEGTPEEWISFVGQLRTPSRFAVADLPPGSPPEDLSNPYSGGSSGFPQRVEDAGVFRVVRPVTETAESPSRSDYAKIWGGDGFCLPKSPYKDEELPVIRLKDHTSIAGAPARQPVKEEPVPEPIRKLQELIDLELIREGVSAWYNLVEAWEKNFGVEGAEQPNRVQIMEEALTDDSRAIFAYLRDCEGLTKAIEKIFLADWGRKKCRRIAEHIAQVSSAMGVPVMSDLLEFDKEYRNILKEEGN